MRPGKGKKEGETKDSQPTSKRQEERSRNKGWERDREKLGKGGGWIKDAEGKILGKPQREREKLLVSV